MVRRINSVGKYSGGEEISRLVKWIFSRMRDMAMSEFLSREGTWTSISSSVRHRVDWILSYSPSE